MILKLLWASVRLRTVQGPGLVYLEGKLWKADFIGLLADLSPCNVCSPC